VERGDALTAFGLAQLGARIYDPVIGRFVSRDPLLIPRTASPTNPYAFAMNDPLNGSDPTGLDGWLPDCMGKECNPDVPMIPVGAIISAIGSLFSSGSSGAPAAPRVSDPALAKRLYDEAMYQAEQQRICGRGQDSPFCNNEKSSDSNLIGQVLKSTFFWPVGVPSYYVKTEVSRAGMMNAQNGVQYFAARDQYNATLANVAMGRINEETERFFGAAMALSGSLMQLGAAGNSTGNSSGSRFASNSRPNFIGASGGYNYRYGYNLGEAAAQGGHELVLGRFPSNVNYVAENPGTLTLDVPSGWTPNYNAGFIRGFLDAGGSIRLVPGEVSGTFAIEIQQILTIPGAPP
jgi:RHS repeat-associated protein